MPLVDKVLIENFQSLAKVEIEFGRVTVFVGDSNVGKTAVMRAIRGLIENWPANSTLRKGATELHVRILSGKNTIDWHRGSGTNTYVVNGQVMKNVGRECPEILRSMLAFHTRRIMDVDFNPNFRDQFSPPALIYESESARLTKLGIISGVGLLQTAVRLASKDRKGLESTARQYADDIMHKEVEIAGYKPIETKEGLVKLMAELFNKLQSAKVVLAKAYDLSDARRKVALATSPALGILPFEFKHRTRIIQSAIELSEARQKITRLGKLPVLPPRRSALLVKGIELSQARKKLNVTLPASLSERKRALMLMLLAIKLKEVRRQIHIDHEPYKQVYEERERKQALRSNILKEMQVCPTCNQKLA